MVRQIHLCLDIRGALENPEELTYFIDENKKPITWQKAREALIEDLRAGHDYFCSCDNRTKEGRCAGHEIKEDSTKCPS